MFASYVAGLFDAEGSIGYTVGQLKGRRVSDLRIYSSNINALKRLSHLLANILNIKSTVYVDTRIRSERHAMQGSILITNRENISRFIALVKPYCRSERSKKLDSHLLTLHPDEYVKIRPLIIRMATEARLKLSPKKRALLFELKSQGKTNEEIARIIGVSNSTVSRHAKNLVKYYH